MILFYLIDVQFCCHLWQWTGNKKNLMNIFDKFIPEKFRTIYVMCLPANSVNASWASGGFVQIRVLCHWITITELLVCVCCTQFSATKNLVCMWLTHPIYMMMLRCVRQDVFCPQCRLVRGMISSVLCLIMERYIDANCFLSLFSYFEWRWCFVNFVNLLFFPPWLALRILLVIMNLSVNYAVYYRMTMFLYPAFGIV